MRLKLLLVMLMAIAASFVFATSASALSMSVDGSTCATCDGSDLYLEIIDNGGSFDVTLTINSDSYTGNQDGLVQVGFGGISGWSSVTLDSAPAGSAVAWSNPIGANVSSSGLCANGATTGKICTDGFVDITGGGDYTWEFTVIGGTLKLDTADWHIGGQYSTLAVLLDTTGKGPKGHLISESGAKPIPEPGAALLFALGAFVCARSVTHRA